MSKRIDRLASALREGLHRHIEGLTLERPWSQIGEEEKEFYRNGVRGVLAALRVPSQAMVTAGESVTVVHSWGSGGEYISAESAMDVWQAMMAEVER